MTASSLTLDDFLPYRLSITTNLVSGVIARSYETLFGLSIAEWRLVAIAAEESEATQSRIGLRSRMDKVTVSRAAIALVERGLLERRKNPGDGRSHILALSEAGQALYAAVAPKALELERRLFASFDPAELARFTDMLQRIDAVTLEMLDESPGA